MIKLVRTRIIKITSVASTTFLNRSSKQKQQTKLSAEILFESQPIHIEGYEIHHGQSTYSPPYRPLVLDCEQRILGIQSDDQHVAGSYVHGLFDTPQSLTAFIKWAGVTIDQDRDNKTRLNDAIQKAADVCSQHLNINQILRIIDQHE